MEKILADSATTSFHSEKGYGRVIVGVDGRPLNPPRFLKGGVPVFSGLCDYLVIEASMKSRAIYITRVHVEVKPQENAVEKTSRTEMHALSEEIVSLWHKRDITPEKLPGAIRRWRKTTCLSGAIEAAIVLTHKLLPWSRLAGIITGKAIVEPGPSADAEEAPIAMSDELPSEVEVDTSELDANELPRSKPSRDDRRRKRATKRGYPGSGEEVAA